MENVLPIVHCHRLCHFIGSVPTRWSSNYQSRPEAKSTVAAALSTSPREQLRTARTSTAAPANAAQFPDHHSFEFHSLPGFVAAGSALRTTVECRSTQHY